MKKRCSVYLGIVCVLLSLTASAQTPGYVDHEKEERLRKEAAEAEIQREELVNLQKETVRALLLHSSSFFNRVYSDDFMGTSPSGVNLDKATLIAEVQDTAMKYTSFVATDIRIRIFQNTAVTMCLWSARGIYQGNMFSRQSRVTTVYVYGQRGWQAVARQETQLPG
jgi:hypothetical protein